MAHWLMAPPITFLIVLGTAALLAHLSSRLAYRCRKETNGSRQSYACGEENYDNSAQPDYSTFFPYAFFFTLAHVATLIITTVPLQTLENFSMAIIYIAGSALGLYILFRKE